MREFLDNALQIVPQPWRSLAIPLLVFLFVFSTGWLARRAVFKRLHQWARTSSTRVDESLIDTLHGPSLMWVMILGIYAATDTSPLPPNAALWADRLLHVLLIVSLTVAVARLAARAVRVYGAKKEGNLPAGTLTEVLASLVVGSIGALMMLRILGIDITAILTALGVGGLAVALALQDTLSNFFAGFYVSVAGQVRVGDLIQLESGLQGFVTDIGWRSTTLRQGTNNMIVIPNNKLAQSIVTNFSLPELRSVVNTKVVVSYSAKSEVVERLLLGAVQEAEIPGMLHEPAPSVLLSALTDAGQEFTVVCHVASYQDQARVLHEVRKRIVREFQDADIAIPQALKRLEPPSA